MEHISSSNTFCIATQPLIHNDIYLATNLKLLQAMIRTTHLQKSEFNEKGVENLKKQSNSPSRIQPSIECKYLNTTSEQKHLVTDVNGDRRGLDTLIICLSVKVMHRRSITTTVIPQTRRVMWNDHSMRRVDPNTKFLRHGMFNIIHNRLC